MSGPLNMRRVNGRAVWMPVHDRRRLQCAMEALEKRALLSSTIFVDASATGTDDGSSWPNAYTNLQSALAAAQADGPSSANPIAIDVAEGTYSPGASPTDTFQLLSDVAIDGGFPSGGAASPEPAAYPTLLSGGGSIGNVVTGSGTDSSAALTGCTITGGNANSGTGEGGGMYILNGSPTISDCVFFGNSGVFGAGLFIGGGDPTILDCIFTQNIATNSGGGICEDGTAAPLVANCLFFNNTADGGAAAMADNASNGAVVNCTFTENTVAPTGNGAGVAIFNLGPLPAVTNCIFWGDGLPGDTEIQTESNDTSFSYCDIEGGFNGAGNIDANPLFVNPAAGNFEIEPDSPEVDAGDNAAVPAGVTTDLAGNPRFQDVPTSAHAGLGSVPIVDMGAYEATAALAANAGGPYFDSAGGDITLAGLGSSAVQGSLSFAWDFDYNGTFTTDAVGPDPVFSAPGNLSGTVLPIALQVTDAGGNSILATSTIEIVPQTLFVDASAMGANNGFDWSTAYTSLQTCLTTAQTVENEFPNYAILIEVGQGTYFPTPFADPRAKFQLIDNVTIEGGFAGVSAATPNSFSPTQFLAILSGDIGQAADNFQSSFNVVTGTGTDSTAVLEGVTITGGEAVMGGGLINLEGSPTIVDCTFSGNSAYNGGAVYNEESTAVFINCVFYDNGGVPGSPENNYGYAAPTGGGAIWNDDSSPLLLNCTFSGNTSTLPGTAIVNAFGSSPDLVNCILWGNGPPGSPEMANEESSGKNPIATNCDVEGGFTGLANINANPLFVNAARGNLQLQSNSPCINTGNAAALPAGDTTDLAGNPRVVGSAVDLGAFEYQSINVLPNTDTWTGDGNDGLWTDAANWSTGQVPGQTSSVIIPADFYVQIPSGTYAVASLAIYPGSTLDLTSAKLFVDYGSGNDPIGAIAADLAAGYNRGLWNGSGIVSSTVATENASQSRLIYSIGFADGADGMISGLSSGQIEMMPTLAGDARLQGVVKFGDFQLLAQQFGTGGNWDQGNFNFGASVSFGDFQLLAQNFGASSSLAASSDPGIAVSSMNTTVLAGGDADTLVASTGSDSLI